MKRTSRGNAIDTAAIMKKYENTVAVGNMRSDAMGRPIDKSATETEHKPKTVVTNTTSTTSLKGAAPEIPETNSKPKKKQPVRYEELPNGDLVAKKD